MSANRHARVWLLALILLWGAPTLATTVYRTVDDDGTVTFSDVPPESGDAQRIEIQTPPPQPDDKQQQRLEAMRATTDRMAAARREREKHRAELRKLRAEASPAYVTEYLPATVYVGGYPRRVHHRFPHRPGHPGARPPLRPETRPSPDFNDYPASLIRRKYSPGVREAFR